MFQLSNSPSRTALVNRKAFLFFSGYSYLGMQHEQGFVELVYDGMEKYGWLFPSSRISNTQLNLFEELEAKLSSITHTAATACFASGFGSGTVASSLFKDHPITVCPEAHPAVNKLKQQALAFDKWAEKTLHIIHENKFDKTPVLIADSVNPLTGEVNDFDFLQYIEKPLIVIVDDSHGMGLLGENGEGIMALLPKKENIEYIVTYSLSKALGINGGAISCTNKATASAIKQLPDFTGSTSMSPALAYAFLNADKIYTQQRKKLRGNITSLKNLLQDNEAIFNDERLPIFILPEQLDEEYFAKKDIIISSFSYPAINGKKINRAVLNALHTEEDLKQLASSIMSG
jgi:8-amino-7-oxononanoate synthase